jgi:hypothetical protein
MNPKNSPLFSGRRRGCHFLAILFFAAGPLWAEEAEVIAEVVLSPAEGEAAIAQLANKESRLKALEQLLTFAGWYYYMRGGSMGISAGNAEQTALMERTSDAIGTCRDFETISQALAEPSATLQYWGLACLFQPSFDADDRWAKLIPQVRKLARCEESSIRRMAIERLGSIEGQREFLSECLESETSLENIMRLLRHFDHRQYKDQMEPRVLTMLDHANQIVRRSSLLFIGFNSNRAEAWQFEFGDSVMDRVLKLSRAENDEERSAAVYALVDLRKSYPEEVRKRILELGDDPCEDVRWRLPGALRDQQERADVQAFLAQLLQDPSPLVQYFTILAMGPTNHITQLQKLAAGKDKKVAEYAASKLKQIENAKH